MDFHDCLTPNFKEYFSPEVFKEWESKEKYPTTQRRVYNLVQMINYPGAKAIEDVREKAAKHKESEHISSQIIEDFIKHFKLPSIQEVWVALKNKLQSVALHFIFQATSNPIEELPRKRKYTKEEKELLPKKKRKSEIEKPSTSQVSGQEQKSTSKVSVTVKPKKEVKKQPKKVPKGNCQFKYLFKCEFNFHFI